MSNKVKVDIVVIGLNCSKTLADCLRSVVCSERTNIDLEIYYVDGGSSDNSIEIARNFREIKVIECIKKYPTPGSQRNAGWQIGRGVFVQFLDSDTILSKDWIKNGLGMLEDKTIGAVCGLRLERYPEKSCFNFIGNLEWNTEKGDIQEFGGDVLVRREILNSTKGYNDNLIAGEDPELSYRVRRDGYRIVRLDELMTTHDLAMYSVKQYLKRSFRTGHAYAENNHSYNEMANKPLNRIVKRGGLSIFLFLSGLVSLFIIPSISILIFIICLLVLFRPRIFLLKKFMENMKLKKEEARIYSLHASVVVVPQLMGVVRYYWGLIFNVPLKNKRKDLKTG